MYEIWEQLQATGYTTKTFEEFKNEYSSEEGQKRLHEKLSASNMTSKSFQDFSSEYLTDPDPLVARAKSFMSIFEPSEYIKPDTPIRRPSTTAISPAEAKIQSTFEDTTKEVRQKTAQAKREARNNIISNMNNVFENNGWESLNEDFKGLSQQEALQNEDVLEAVYKQASQNYTALQPDIPLSSAMGDYSPSNIKSQFVANQQQKEQEAIIEKIDEASNTAYQIYGDELDVWLTREMQASMERMKPSERVLAADLDVMRKQKQIINNPESTQEQIAQAKLKIAELQPQVANQLKGLDEDYTFLIDPATGNRIDGDIDLSGPSEVVDATADVKSQAGLLAQLGQADEDNFRLAFIDFSLDRQAFNETSSKTINYKPEGDLGNAISEKLYKKGYRYQTAPNGDRYFANVPLKEFIYYSKRLGDDSLIKEYIPSDQAAEGADIRMDIPSTLTQLREDAYNLKIREQALNQAYLLNIDPSSMDKSFLGTMTGAATKRVFGEAATTEFFPAMKSTREQLDQVQKLYTDVGIIQTQAQKKNFERDSEDIAGEGLGYILPELPAFFLGGRIVGATMEIAGAGRNFMGIIKAGKLRDKFGNIPMIGKTNIPFTPAAQKITYYGLRGLQEEATFQLATGGKAELGSGATFALGGSLARKAFPFRLKGNAARYNPLLEKVILGGAGFATGSEAVELSKAVYNQVIGEKGFQDSLEELYGEDSKFLQRFWANYITGAALGVTHMSKYDFKSVKQLEAIHRKYLKEFITTQAKFVTGQAKDPNFKNTEGGRELQRQLERTRDKIQALQPVLNHANDAYLKSNLQEKAKEKQKALATINNPKSTALEIKEAENTVKEVDALIATNKSHLEKALNEIKQSGELGDFDFVIQEGKEGFQQSELNNRAVFRPGGKNKKPKIIIDLLEYRRGTLAHEVTHLAMYQFFKNNPAIAGRFRNALAELINSKLKGTGLTGDERATLQELIKDTYENKSQRPEEWVTKVVELLQNPTYSRILLEQGVFNGIRKSFMNLLRDNKLKPENMQLDNFNVKTAQDLLNFLGTFAKNIEGGRNVAQTIKDFKDIIILGDKPIDANGKPIIEAGEMSMGAKDLITQTEKNDVFSKGQEAYDMYKDNIDAAGVMVGMEYEPLVKAMVDSKYRYVPGYQQIRDLLIDGITTGLAPEFNGIPALVKSYNPEKGTKLSTYITGQLENRIKGIIAKSFPELGRVYGFEEGQVEKMTESEGLGGGGGLGFVDLSSYEKTTRYNDAQLKQALKLPQEFFELLDNTVDRILKKPLANVEAKEVIEYNLGEKGTAKADFYENYTADVTIDGVTEKIKARTPSEVEKYLKKKGYTVEGQDKLGDIKKQMINEFRNDAFNELQKIAGGTTNKGTAASPEYVQFIERSWSLYKNFLSQRSINKRFADFKEPVLDKTTGKQLREQTAQGNPIFTKKNITKAEWIKYFEGDGNIRIDGRRRALLESIAEEVGFDRVMNKLFDKSYQEQIRSRQEALGNDLVENYAIILGKKLDRMSPEEISFAAKDFKEIFKDIVGTRAEYERGEKPYGSWDEVARNLNNLADLESGYLFDKHPAIAEALENHINENFKPFLDTSKIKKDQTSLTQILETKGIKADEFLIKEQKDFTDKDVEVYSEGMKDFIYDLHPSLMTATEKQTNRAGVITGSYIGTVWGFNKAKLNAAARNEILFDKNNNIKLGEGWLDFKQEVNLIQEKLNKGIELSEYEKLSLAEYNTAQKFLKITKGGTLQFAYRSSELGVLEKLERIETLDLSAKAKTKLAEAYKQTESGKEALRVADSAKLLLKYQMLHLQRLSYKNENILNQVASLFRFNNNSNLFRYLVPIESFQFTDGKSELNTRLEHDLAKAKFAASIFEAIYKGELTPERYDQLSESWRGTVGEGEAQTAFDKIYGATFSENIDFKRAYMGKTPLNKKGIADFEILKQNLKNTFNIRTGKSEWDMLVERTAQDLYNQLKPGETSVKEIVESINYNADNLQQISESFAARDITKEFDAMLERKSGLKGEISGSRARQLGKGKGKFDLYIPPNAEDFAGLLYKLYGRGEQGNRDMEFVKETLLLPYERGENMISSYRQQISNKFKSFNKALKAFDNKFDKNAVKAIEDAGYTVDQALRVWIWDKLGYDIPDITVKEQASLVNIVRNNPKLLGTALQFKNMFGAGRPYPEPSADWYGSNIKLDAHRYINKGARRMFLEEFINNSKEAFTSEFYAKAEAAFGKGYVKNLQQMLDAMITGQSRPENLPEYATLALNYLNGAVGNIMFLNNRSAILQTISMTNYINWTDNNILAAGKTLTNPKEFAKTWMELMNSDFLKQRRDGLEISIEEAEIAKSLEDSQNTITILWGKLLKLGYTPTKFADSFAIASGGTPFYLNRTKTYLKKGFSEAEAKKMAFEDFRMLTETHQQSSRQDKISNVQRGLMGRLTYSFSGAPFQMAREQKKAALNFINRRGSDRENISKFFYYGAVQNLIFTAMQQGAFAMMFEDDEVLADKRTARLANSMLDTFLRSSGLPGAMLAMGKNAIIKYMAENEKGYQGDMGNVIGEVLNISPPIGSKFRNIYGGLKSRKYLLHTKKGRKEVEAAQGFLDNPLNHANAKIIAGVTNFQTNRFMTKAENMDIAITGKYDATPWQRIALAGGWDKWSLGFYDKKEDEGPKKTRSEIMKEVWVKKNRDRIQAAQKQDLRFLIKK